MRNENRVNKRRLSGLKSSEYKMHKSPLSDLIAKALIMLLIASLPFSTFRFGFQNLSLTNISMLLITIFGLFFMLFGKLKRPKINTFDLLHVMFLIVAAFSVFTIRQPESGSVLLKTVLTVSFYFSLKAVFNHLSEYQLRECLVDSSRIGTVAFTLLFALACAQPGVLSAALSSGLNFYGFTLNVYREMFQFFGLDSNILGTDVRRNTIGGVFALYFGILTLNKLFWNIKGKMLAGSATSTILIILCVLFTLALFSRRAMLMCVLIYALISLFSTTSKTSIYVTGLTVVAVTSFIVIKLQVENRFSELSDDARFDQFNDAWYAFLDNAVTGVGYGAKIGVGNLVYVERYVHNFHLANTYMLGIFGLLFSIVVTWQILDRITTLKNGNRNMYVVLLIIPLLSSFVAGAVEGLYVPVSWIIFAFCFRSRMMNDTSAR